ARTGSPRSPVSGSALPCPSCWSPAGFPASAGGCGTADGTAGPGRCPGPRGIFTRKNTPQPLWLSSWCKYPPGVRGWKTPGAAAPSALAPRIGAQLGRADRAGGEAQREIDRGAAEDEDGKPRHVAL